MKQKSLTITLFTLCILGLAVSLTACGRECFVGSRTAEAGSYRLDIDRMTGTDRFTMELRAGDTLAVQFETVKGSIYMLYHKSTELRASDAASAIRGYHNQHICFRSLPEYFSYITNHDAYRMHHPEAPRAALAQKPPKQKEPPRKGKKRWHKEQTRRRAAERKRAIRNVLALIDLLDANYAARPAV